MVISKSVNYIFYVNGLISMVHVAIEKAVKAPTRELMRKLGCLEKNPNFSFTMHLKISKDFVRLYISATNELFIFIFESAEFIFLISHLNDTEKNFFFNLNFMICQRISQQISQLTEKIPMLSKIRLQKRLCFFVFFFDKFTLPTVFQTHCCSHGKFQYCSTFL